MRDGPDGAVLLAIARRTLLDEVLSEVPKSTRYTVRMIANAIAITRREMALDRAMLEQKGERQLRAIYRTAGLAEPAAELSFREVERCFARDLRAGCFDANEALIVPFLEARVRARLALANPKALSDHVCAAP